MAGKPVKERHTEVFLAHRRAHFRNDADLDSARAVCAVFKVLGQRVSEGEIKDIGQLLPKELKAFWSEAVGLPEEVSVPLYAAVSLSGDALIRNRTCIRSLNLSGFVGSQSGPST